MAEQAPLMSSLAVELDFACRLAGSEPPLSIPFILVSTEVRYKSR